MGHQGHGNGPRFGLPGDRVLTQVSTREAQQELASAYADRVRPRCLCVAAAPEMYIAKVGGGFIVKRMPETGLLHAAGCESYCPPEHLSGLAEGEAEDTAKEATNVES